MSARGHAEQSGRAPFSSLEMTADCRWPRHIPEVPLSLSSSVLFCLPLSEEARVRKTLVTGWWDHGTWERNCELCLPLPLVETGDSLFPSQDGRFEDVQIKPAELLAQEGPGLISSLPWGGFFCRDWAQPLIRQDSFNSKCHKTPPNS